MAASSADSVLRASGAICAASSEPSRQRARKRFKIDEDLLLLREVVAQNPFERPETWNAVLQNVAFVVGREMTLRAVRRRVEVLVEYFRQQDSENLGK
ncbi:hypothetical protein V5799_025847 [Amblyomma americanum]|uniref:Uncharacterized protein n=1 Tax=Amblyomma americanum TaxID=6943 RepID=A0AAQ4E842_AMBAM